MPQKSPETILREALVVACDELKRVNDQHACIRPDVRHAVYNALALVQALPPIEHASETERRIVGKLVQDALTAGHSLSVWDGEEMTVVESRDANEIYKALASTDSDSLYIHIREKNPPCVVLIWGNDEDVISDYNTSLENLLKGANDLAEALS